MDVKKKPVGDRALCIEFTQEISEAVNDRIHGLKKQLEQNRINGVIEYVPTFCSLLVHYDPKSISYPQLCKEIDIRLQGKTEAEKRKKRILKVPVCYGARFSPDLSDMEKILKMDREEIIAIHSSHDYKIYMMGFLPGFPYLGGMDERIACPRLSSPRLKIPAGAVGIGGSQTGIYPMESPGGWRLIGQTPIPMYQPNAKNPVPVEAGDLIRFVPIDLDEWYDIRREVVKGTYCYERLLCEETGVTQEEREPIQVIDPSTAGNEEKNAAMELIVEQPGALTTIQDGGRFGSLAIGLTESGAMDRQAYALANQLLGNDANAAVLEMTVFGASFLVKGSGWIVVTGADMTPTRNGVPFSMNYPIFVQDQDVIACGVAKSGCRAYLGCSGGILTEPILASRSTNLKCKIGGIHGGALKAGDCIPCGKKDVKVKKGVAYRPYSQNVTLHYIKGPQEDVFSKEAYAVLERSVYTVGKDSDRMGYRLEGNPIPTEKGTDIISDGIVFGSIQIPANGMPIVLMADHQTTGGYAKIGTVISEDLPKLAQLLPGGKIRFHAVDVKLHS